MLRKLPLTITADETPDWLPVGWVVHSTGLRRGRLTRTYTHLRTGKKLFTKDQVLEYIKMDKIREDREAAIQRKKLRAFQDNEAARERPSWLPDDREAELKIGSFYRNPFYTINENMSSGFKPHSEQEVLQCHNTKESEAASSGKLEVARERPFRLPDDSKAEPGSGSYGGTPYKINENMTSGFKTHSEQEVLQCHNTKESEADLSGKIEETGSDYITYDYNTDEEDWSDNEGSRENVNIIPTPPLRLQPERMKKLESRAITQCLLDDEGMSSDTEENIQEVETTKVENELEEANLHDVGVDEAREIPGLTGSLSIEINLNCEPASDSLLEKELNKSGTEETGTRNIEIRYQESDSVPISESGGKNEKPLKTQATQGENSNARSSADDLINPCPDTSQEKNIIGSTKRKKSAEPCSAKNIKKKDTEARPDKFRKGKKTPRKPHGEKGRSSVNIEEETVEWPEPDPTFPFEPIRIFEYDDSIIEKYLEEYYAGAGSDRSNLPLPDFGLPSFSNIQISRDEEPECKKEKSPDPTCVKIASSSLPCC